MSKRIKEAWAMAVDAFFTYGLYRDLNSGFNPLSEEKVAERFYQSKGYTLNNYFWGFGGFKKMYTQILIDILEGDTLPYYDKSNAPSFPYGPHWASGSVFHVPFNQSDRYMRCKEPREMDEWGKRYITNIWDEVSNLGITLRYIKDKVKPRSSFRELRNKIMEDFADPEKTKIKDAFDQYRKKHRSKYFNQCESVQQM